MQKIKGSILAYSLIILAMMIAIVTTMSVATVIEKKSASSTDFSVQAYQTADSGVQLSIKKINGNSSGTLASVFGSCNSGVVQNVNDAGAGLYDLSFYSDDKITDDTTLIKDCNTLASTIRSIKSVGKFKDTVRAVQVAVAASSSMDCIVKIKTTASDSLSVLCDSGYIATGGGCDSLYGIFAWNHPYTENVNGEIIPTGWVCAKQNAVVAEIKTYAICCKK